MINLKLKDMKTNSDSMQPTDSIDGDDTKKEL